MILFTCEKCGCMADDGDVINCVCLRCIDREWEDDNNDVTPHRCTDEAAIELDRAEGPRPVVGRSDT